MLSLQEDHIHKLAQPAPDQPVFHAVLTRFNVRTMREDAGIQSREALSDWIGHRLPIFRDVCLPSLLAQTRRPDAWLIGFDDTEPELVAEVIRLIEPHPWIRPVWHGDIDGEPETLKSFFHRHVLEALGDVETPVITSRLDNDDALAVPFCENTVRYAQDVLSRHPEIADFWISFPLGVQLMDDVFRMYVFNRNPFLSRCVRPAVLRGPRHAGLVTRINHRKLFDARHVFTPATDRPMWLQNIHENNLANSNKPTLPILGPTAWVRAWFGLAEQPAADVEPGRPGPLEDAEPPPRRHGLRHRRRRAAILDAGEP